MGIQFAGNILTQSNGEPLPISMGGTGQTTAPTAINALLPIQSNQAGKVLKTDGTNVSWSLASGQPGGANTQIQFNDAGTFGASTTIVINKVTGALASTSTFTSTGLNITGAATDSRTLAFQTEGSDRWFLKADATSDFEFVRVADNGLTTNQVYTVSRATGAFDFKSTPTVNGSPIATSTSASALTGSTLASNVVSSSLTSVGTLTSLAVTGAITTNGRAVGYLAVPQNIQNTGYTLQLSDAGNHIFTITGGATWTIPANSSVVFPVGTAVTFVNQSTSPCTIAIVSDTLYLGGAGTTGSRTLGSYGFATALKTSTTTWIISGTSLS